MGFLKRFFSLGSRKSKKRQHHHRTEPMPADAQGRLHAAEPWQAETTRLLRSSSAHFAAVSEVDCSSLLPPLPHPINSVFNTPVATPARSATSAVKRSGTYTVTVHGRTIHSRTEFPNANPPLNDQVENARHTDLHHYDESPTKTRSRPNPRSVPLTPHDQSRVLRLRQDPSVASLLNMYDDKGRIQSNAFSNTPPTPAPVYNVEGREQKKRTGSTLRQLLGEPQALSVADCTAMEGDISWAERELALVDRTSMTSFASDASLPLETPKDSQFNDGRPEPGVVRDATFGSDVDSSAHWPLISSLEVELSGSINSHYHTMLDGVSPFEHDMDNSTPQRASEVFGFLTERRKSILERNRAMAVQNLTPLPALAVPGLAPLSRTLPASSSTTSTAALTAAASSSNSSPTTSSDTSSAQIHHATLTKLTPMSRSTDTLNILYTPSSVKALPALPTTSIAPVPSMTMNAGLPSKIPRGPRPAPAAGSSYKHTPGASQTPLYRQTTISTVSISAPDAILESRIPKSSAAPSRPFDPYTPVHKRTHRRTVSRTSSAVELSLSGEGEGEGEDASHRPARSSHCQGSDSRSRPRPRRADKTDKENGPCAVPAKTYPKTPAVSRSHSRALFEVRHPNLVDGSPPSPASSAELSPVGREMMSDVRKKGMHFREQTRIVGAGRGVKR